MKLKAEDQPASDSESIADVFENFVESIFNSSDSLHYAPSGILYQLIVFLLGAAGLYIACGRWWCHEGLFVSFLTYVFELTLLIHS